MAPSKNKKSFSCHAFTLIEVVVVVSTLAVALPIVTLILFAILRQQLAVTRMSEVKKQGDQAITFIQTMLEQEVRAMYAADGSQLCENASGSIATVDYFMDADGNKIHLILDQNNLSVRRELVSGADSNDMLTDNAKVFVEPVSVGIPLAQCVRSRSFARPIIGVQFSIVPAGTMSNDEREGLRMHFFTKIAINTL
ncbi:MAG TPA: hypothetical protein PKG71_00520 [Candidatus Woesebacteria bacterium]|nr:hypothetical protein [Candidatus Woesebacteria bacterium]HNS94441.1 hypothetical protein [Candidatus Woesebacteria bacterium]